MTKINISGVNALSYKSVLWSWIRFNFLFWDMKLEPILDPLLGHLHLLSSWVDVLGMRVSVGKPPWLWFLVAHLCCSLLGIFLNCNLKGGDLVSHWLVIWLK